MPIRNILDLLEEELAIRAGLLLTDHDVFMLLDNTNLKPCMDRLKGNSDEVIGIRAEVFDDMARVLRAEVGNLPDGTPGSLVRICQMKEMLKMGLDPNPVIKAFLEEIETGNYQIIGEEVCEAVKRKTGASDFLVDSVFLMFADDLERTASVFLPQPRHSEASWDGLVPLSDLFNNESIPDNPDAYLDQRFLDYLIAQPNDFQKMYWRNFERFVAEYFSRQGYVIKLGRGTKDGGIDVRVWPATKTIGPPLMLIQCKRYNKSSLVKVEYIKALWSDVFFEGAQKGLIVTTSRVTPEAKRLASVRKYPLDFAENEKVKEWARSMWRYSWKEKTSTDGVGQYFLPPFYPIEPGDLDFLENDKK
jgi:restriction system protein